MPTLPLFRTDLTVLDQDITAIDQTEIAATGVEATMVGGRFEFNPAGIGR